VTSTLSAPLGDLPSAAPALDSLAVVVEEPRRLALRRVELTPPGEADVVVEPEWTGISTGTERLLFQGDMPPFPGMGYPLVPGYETVGRVTRAGSRSGRRVGERVFVPGARCFPTLNPLFGGAASRLVVPGARVVPVRAELGDRAVLLALAATAQHVLAGGGDRLPELIVGHGVLGRLLARLVVLAGGRPVVWEVQEHRRSDAPGCGTYRVVHPDEDGRRDYPVVCDASGNAGLLDELVERLAPGGELVLAGFYGERLSFAFPPAFLREARLRIAAEWSPPDLEAVLREVDAGRLSLDGLVTHRRPAHAAADAYATAFGDPACLKMVLDWRES